MLKFLEPLTLIVSTLMILLVVGAFAYAYLVPRVIE
jgi:hypothetical protein